MRYLALLLLTAAVASAQPVFPPLPSTVFTRSLLKAADAPAARTILGIDSSITSTTAIITNLIVGGAASLTNTWAGPTNTIALGTNYSGFYSALVPCSVTGFEYNSGLDCAGLLTIRNASSSNITVLVPASVVTGDGSKSYTITNGYDGVLSLRVAYGKTNAVFRMFW